METLAVLGTVSAGAYLISKATRREVEAMEKTLMNSMELSEILPPPSSSLTALVQDTRKASMDNAQLQPTKSVLNKEDFLQDAHPALPDPERSQTIPQPLYWRPNEERLNPFEPEIGFTGLTEPKVSRYSEYDRIATLHSQRDFRDAQGNVPDSFATGVERPERLTPGEALRTRTTPQVQNLLEPHVKRVNDDAGRAVAIQPFFTSTERARPEETVRRNLIEGQRTFGTHSSYHPVEGRPATADWRLEKDTALSNRYSAVSSYYSKENRPEIEHNLANDIEGRILYQPPVTKTGANVMHVPANLNQMQVRRPNRKLDEIQRRSSSTANVPNAPRQAVMWNHYRKRDILNERGANTTPYTTVDASTKAQSTVRRPGLRIETAAFFPHYPQNMFDRATKPPVWGATKQDSLSSTVYNKTEEDTSDFIKMMRQREATQDI